MSDPSRSFSFPIEESVFTRTCEVSMCDVWERITSTDEVTRSTPGFSLPEVLGAIVAKERTPREIVPLTNMSKTIS